MNSNYRISRVWRGWIDAVGADDIIQHIRSKVITGKNITT
jgi:hypothetical protein